MINRESTFIQELAAKEGVCLDSGAAERLGTYIGLVEKWSTRMNLIGPGARRRFWSDHIAECLIFGERIMEAREWTGAMCADIGSGAGLPGLVTAILHPEANVTLIESRRKKASFLRTAAYELGLKRVSVLSERIPCSRQKQIAGKFDICTSRAADQIESVIEKALWLLKGQGLAWLLVSRDGTKRAANWAAENSKEAAIEIRDQTDSLGRLIWCVRVVKTKASN